MKRFTSITHAVALAAALVGAGTAANADSTMSLVPVSPAGGFYQPGDIITVAVVLTLGTGSFASFTVPTAVGYLNSQFDDPDTSAGPQAVGNGQVGFGPDTTVTFTGPNASGGTSQYQLWNLNAPNILDPTGGAVNGETVQCAAAAEGHPNKTITINGVKQTLAVPAGTYTLATFAFAVTSTYPAYPGKLLTLYLPTPNGFSNNADNTDGAFMGGVGPPTRSTANPPPEPPLPNGSRSRLRASN